MNNKQADKIIKNYKPYKGFYDLSEKPKSLTKIEYAKVLRIQEFLVEQEKNKKSASLFYQWQKIKEISANYQKIVREHWGLKTIIKL